jgi:glucose uptake protein GlcU
MFYQWVMCTGIFVWGVAVQLVLFAINDPMYSHASSNTTLCEYTADKLIDAASTDAYSVKFFPYAILGGAFWATGNTMSVPIINSIGMGMGVLTWGAANMLMGWATGSFGLFGTSKDELATPALNYVGVTLALIALIIYTQVRSGEQESASVEPLTISMTSDGIEKPTKNGNAPRVVGIVMAISAGILFGNTFTPPNYIMDNGWGPRDGLKPLDYVFSHFTGIYVTSCFWFMVYCGLKMNKGEAPAINPQLVLPALLSGVIWAIAQTAWFVANANLGVAVAFPIITSGPGIISAVWGVFVFKEIHGKRNFIVLIAAICISVTGCIMIGASKG